MPVSAASDDMRSKPNPRVAVSRPSCLIVRPRSPGLRHVSTPRLVPTRVYSSVASRRRYSTASKGCPICATSSGVSAELASVCGASAPPRPTTFEASVLASDTNGSSCAVPQPTSIDAQNRQERIAPLPPSGPETASSSSPEHPFGVFQTWPLVACDQIVQAAIHLEARSPVPLGRANGAAPPPPPPRHCATRFRSAIAAELLARPPCRRSLRRIRRKTHR